MTFSKAEIRANIRKNGQFRARGRRGHDAMITVEVYDDGSFTATADIFHITLNQFRAALVKVYGHGVRVENVMGGYLRGEGKAK